MSNGLSPNDIRNYEFSNQMRGFDKDEVKEFLEQVAVVLDTLKQENLKLSMQTDSLKTQLESVKQFEDTIKGAAIDARRNADATVADAKEKAHAIMATAKEEAEELITSRERRVQQLEQTLTKLEMSRTSYLTKLRDLIDSHRELVDEVARVETPEYTPSKPTVAAVAAAAVDPTSATDKVETVGDTFEGPSPEENSLADTGTIEIGSPDATNGLEVTDSSEVSRHKLETIGTRVEHDEADNERPEEEDAAPNRIVAAESGEAPEQPEADAPLDPELAAALENYQRANAETPELSRPETPAPPAPPQNDMQETTALAEDIPSGFIPAADETVKTTKAALDTNDTGAIKSGTDGDESTEHNAIDIDQPLGTERVPAGTDNSSDDIANELDAVAAKFEEEMDKAAKA